MDPGEDMSFLPMPETSITLPLLGLLNGWSYDYNDPINQLRDKSVLLHNAIGHSLQQYGQQLKEKLRSLRQALPEPSAENPFPDPKQMQPIRTLERFIREVEALRTAVENAAVPATLPRRGQGDIHLFYAQLQSLDCDLLQATVHLNQESIEDVRAILGKRDQLVRSLTLG